jgi:hypothetical protein
MNYPYQRLLNFRIPFDSVRRLGMDRKNDVTKTAILDTPAILESPRCGLPNVPTGRGEYIGRDFRHSVKVRAKYILASP